MEKLYLTPLVRSDLIHFFPMDLQAESPLSEKRPKHPCLVCFIISQPRLLHPTGTELKAVDLAQRSTYCHFL